VKNLVEEKKGKEKGKTGETATEAGADVQKADANVKKADETVQKTKTDAKADADTKKTDAKNAVVEKKSPLAFFKKNPWLIAGIVCIAIIAVLVVSLATPNTADLDDFHGVESNVESVIKMIIISSNKCIGCEEANSFEVLFSAEGIKYVTQTIEESTAEGKALIQSLGIKKLPAYVIEEESIGPDAIVTTSDGESISLKEVLQIYTMQGKGTYGEGIFVFPEMDLDGFIRPKILLEEACGDANNINIQIFADPYDPNSIIRTMDMQNFVKILKEDINVSFGYNYLPTYSRILEDWYLYNLGGSQTTVRDNIEGAAKYLVCANDAFGFEKFSNLQKEMYALYCDLNSEEMDFLGAEELSKCNDSNHYQSFITGEEMNELTRKAMIYDGIILSECLYNIENGKFPASIELAEAVGINITPTALINCQYEVPIEHMGTAVCEINNNLVICG